MVILVDKGAYKFLQKAGDLGVFKFDFTKLERRTTEERAIELVTQKLYANGLLAKWTPEMTMGDLRGKAIVIFQGFSKEMGYGNLKDHVVLTDETNMKLTTPSESASVKYVEQNQWEVGGNFAKAEFDPNRISPLVGTNPNSASDPERFANLFDDDPSTKWCVSWWYKLGAIGEKSSWRVKFCTTEPFTAKSYTLFSAYDTGAYPKRNPKMWRLYAALNENDDLVMIDHRDVESNGADGIPAENYKGKTYTIQHPGKYRYYALLIFDNWGDRYMQLGGFRFEEWEK